MHNNDVNKNDKTELKTFVFEDTEYKTLLTKKFENRAQWKKPDEREIHSHLPGTMKKVEVKPGDKVEKGDVLVVYEAMKMMNSIKSNQKGIIKKVHIAVGDKFPKNTLLLEFE
jgi:biotin carboxyl carrier protein